MAQLPSDKDVEVATLLQSNEKNRLETVRNRAKSWLGAISAITALFGFALVVSGPNTVDGNGGILEWAKILIGVLMLSGFLALAFSIYCAYQAAFGSPTALEQMDPNLRAGIAAEYYQEKRLLAKHAQEQASYGINSFVYGVVLVVAALGVSWFVPRGESICLFTEDDWGNATVVAKIRGGEVTSFTFPIVHAGNCP